MRLKLFGRTASTASWSNTSWQHTCKTSSQRSSRSLRFWKDLGSNNLPAALEPVKQLRDRQFFNVHWTCKCKTCSPIAVSRHVDAESPLMDLGLDSLSAIDLQNLIASSFPFMVDTATVLFDYPTLRELTEHIVEQSQLAGV